MGIDSFKLNLNNIRLNKLHKEFNNTSNISYNNQDMSANLNKFDDTMETYDVFDYNESSNGFDNARNNATDDVRNFIDQILLNDSTFSNEELIKLYSAENIEVANEILMNIYVEKFGNMYGFTKEETEKLLNNEATFEEIFNSDFKKHMNKYLYFSSSVLSLSEDEKNELLSCGSWEKSFDIFNDIDKRKLMESGLFEVDANRVINGEITYEELLAEIMSEETDYRRQQLITQNLLVQNGYSSLHELALEIANLENQVREGNKKLFGDTEYNEYYWTMELIAQLQNAGYTSYSVNQLNEYAERLVVGYSYIDKNGNLIYSREDPYSTLSSDEIATMNVLYYSDIFGTTNSYSDLLNYVNANQFSFNGSNLNSMIGELNIKYEENKNDFEIYKENIDKLTNDLFAKKNLRDYILSYATYYTDNIMEYTRKDNFDENSHVNNTLTNNLDNIFNLSNYTTDSESGDSVFKDNPYIKFHDSGMTLTLMVEDKETVMKMIYSMISGDGKINKDILQVAGSELYLSSDNYPILKDYFMWAPIMTEEEKACFYYKYNTEGYEGAYDYLIDIRKELDQRWLAQKTREDQEYAKEHPVLASIASVLVTPVEGMVSFFYSMECLIQNEEIMRSHVYSSGDVYRTKISSDIALNFGSGWSTLYGVGMSMADTAVLIAASYATGGIAAANFLLSAGLMGTRSYVSSLNNALDLGLSDGSAVTLAFSTAVVETMMESYSVGHLVNLEKGLSNGLMQIIEKCPAKLQKVVYVAGSCVSQGLAEGEEELCTSIVSFFAEQLIAGELSGYNQSIDNYIYLGHSEEEAISLATKDFRDECVQSFVGGFISGLGFGSFSGISSTIPSTKSIANNIMLDYNAAATNPTDIHTIRKQLRNGDYEGIITQIMNDSNVDIDNRVKSANNFIECLEINYGIDINTKNELTSLVIDAMSKKQNDTNIKDFVSNLKMKFNYSNELCGYLDNFIPAVISYYGKSNAGIILEALDNCEIHMQGINEDMNSYLNEYFDRKTNLDIPETSGGFYHNQFSLKDGVVTSKPIIYIKNIYMDKSLGNYDFSKESMISLLTHELCHLIKGYGKFTYENGQIIESCGLIKQVYEFDSEINDFKEVKSFNVGIEEAFNCHDEAQLMTAVTGVKHEVGSYSSLSIIASALMGVPEIKNVIIDAQLKGDNSWIEYFGENTSNILIENFDKIYSIYYEGILALAKKGNEIKSACDNIVNATNEFLKNNANNGNDVNNTNKNDNVVDSSDAFSIFTDILNKEGKNKGRQILLMYSKFGESSNIPSEYKNMLKSFSKEDIKNYLNVGNMNVGFQFFGDSISYYTNQIQVGLNAIDQNLGWGYGINALANYINNGDTSLLLYDSNLSQIVKSLDINTLIECYNSLISNYIQYNTNAQVKTINQEIFESMPQNLEFYSMARYLYLELSKRLNYDTNYLLGDESYKANIYNNKITFDKLYDNKVICKGWSELYVQLLKEAGFDERLIRIVGDNQTGSHKWVEIDCGDYILFADATANFKGINDLATSKGGSGTVGFLYLPKSYSGINLNGRMNIEQPDGSVRAVQIYDTVDQSWLDWNNDWLHTLDNSIGYTNEGLYFNELLTSIKKDFYSPSSVEKIFGGDNNIIYQSKINTFFNMEIPNGMDALDACNYFRQVNTILFDGDKQNYIIPYKRYLSDGTPVLATVIAVKSDLEQSSPYLCKIIDNYSGMSSFTFNNLPELLEYLKSVGYMGLK